jgi:hypothetical protein
VAQLLPPSCPNTEVMKVLPPWLCWGKPKRAGMAEEKAQSGTGFRVWDYVGEAELESGVRWVGFPLLEYARWIELCWRVCGVG